jgi:polysaccharide deacetylase 2 family uncharacterized protein YibQ
LAQAGQTAASRRRGVGIAGILAIVLLIAGVAGAAWLVLTEPQPSGGVAEVVLELPAPPTTPAAEASPVESAAAGGAETPAVEPSAPPEVAADSPAPETTEVAALTPPVADEASLPAWRRFARAFPANDARPRIAIVVNALGQKEELTRAAIQQLPPEVTLSFSPYAGCALKQNGDLTCSDRLDELMAAAREAGHEVLLDLPMEPRTYPSDDPGPRALLTSLDDSENAERLDWVLNRSDGYVGVATYMGSRFTASPEHLRPVLEKLGERGLLFFDSSYGAGSAGPELAAELGVPRAVNERFLDSEPSRAAIDARLAQLERQARAKGAAVAMALPYPVTVERISGWAKTLAEKGVTLAPISALVDTRAGQ